MIEKGTGNGTVSDIDGNFSLSVAAGATLSVSYIGYLEQEVTIREGQTRLLVKLQEDTQRLDEVVVVGYGTVRKRDLTGAVSSVKSEDIMRAPTSNVIEAIQGQVPGLDITRSSGEAGAEMNRELLADIPESDIAQMEDTIQRIISHLRTEDTYETENVKRS